VTKGAACSSAATCATGQECDGEGRCYWEPPVGELGDSCAYDQFCVSNSCVETTDGSFCASDCIVGASDTCPKDFECVSGGTSGFCLPKEEDGGCPCGVTGHRRTRMPWATSGVALFVLAFVLRRRRRR
jgi:hypothetical protein